MVLIKLEKAFDGVLMEVLQWVLEKKGDSLQIQ